MIDLLIIAKKTSVDDDFYDELSEFDDNDDGIIDGDEVLDLSQKALDSLRDMADSHAEWDIIKELALLRGEYKSIVDDGITKGIDPGQGGRFRLMVDRLMDRGYPEVAARSIAVLIGKQKYAWMR